MGKKLTRSAVFMFVILIISKCLGLGRDVLLAYKFGTTAVNDAFTMAISVPEIMFAAFVSGVIQAYIPYISRIKNKKEKNKFFSIVLLIVFLLSLIISLLFCNYSSTITHMFAPGYSSTAFELMNHYIKIIVWIFPFYSLFSVMSAHLQSNEKFTVPYFCDYIIVNIVGIIFILCADYAHNNLLVIGQLSAHIVSCSVLVIYFIRQFGNIFSFDIRNYYRHFVGLLSLAIPIGICFMMNQINAMTDKVFSSMLGEGFTSSLNYANKIQILFLTLTTTVFSTVCFPRINSYFSEGDKESGLYYGEKGYQLALFFSVPFTIIIAIFSLPIVKLIFERGEFNSISSLNTSVFLRYYSLGIVFYSLSEVQSRLLSADMKQKVLLKNTVIVVLFNIIADYVLMKLIGGPGLSLATSLAGILMFLLMSNDLHRFNLTVPKNKIKLDAPKIVAVSIISAIASYYCFIFLGKWNGSDISLFLAIICYGIIYVLMNLLLKTSICMWFFDQLIKMVKKE